jgi:hypothetical protein
VVGVVMRLLQVAAAENKGTNMEDDDENSDNISEEVIAPTQV